MGDFNADLLFPFPQQDAEDKKIGDTFSEKVANLLTEHLDPEEVDRTREIPKTVIEELGKMGAFAMKGS